MKNIKTFKDFEINENIIDFDTENIRNFYNTLKEELRNFSRTLSIKRMKDVALDDDIEVVDYNTFYKELPDSQKSTAPPRYDPPAFALVNPVTHKARIVMSAEQLDRGLLEYIYHMLKHENVHVGQYNRGGLRNLPDPKNQSEYFSDKNEVMAFAQSIVDMLKDTCDTKEEALKSLRSNRLYRDVKNSVDAETLKRYNKYIYLYLNKQYGEDELDDKSNILKLKTNSESPSSPDKVISDILEPDKIYTAIKNYNKGFTNIKIGDKLKYTGKRSKNIETGEISYLFTNIEKDTKGLDPIRININLFIDLFG